MNLKESIKKAVKNVTKKKSVVYETDDSLTSEEYGKIESKIYDGLKNIINENKNLPKDEKIILESGERVSEEQLEESINRLIEESEIQEKIREQIKDDLLTNFTEYLESRNLTEEEIDEFAEEYLESGINQELKDKIINKIVENLESNNYDKEAIAMAKTVLEDEIQRIYEDEFSIQFENIRENLVPEETKYKKFSALPIIQVQNYPLTLEGIKDFGDDYGISENLINDLLDSTDKLETLNKIADELDSNHCFLGNEEENEKIRQYFLEDMTKKLKILSEEKSIKPIEALEQIYTDLGFSDEQKQKFLNNAKVNGNPGEGFYKVAKSCLEKQQKEMYEKINLLSDKTVKGKKVKTKISKENKEILKEDFRMLIKMRQQAFYNLYSLNKLVNEDNNNLMVSSKTYDIIDVKKAEKTKTANNVKRKTLKQFLNMKGNLLNKLFKEGKEKLENNENEQVATLKI